MEQLLKTYQETIDKIFEGFDIENGYGELDIRIDHKWNADSNTVRWLEKDELYSNDVLNKPMVSKCGLFTMIYVDNGCGDRYYQIFKNENKQEDLEDEY